MKRRKGSFVLKLRKVWEVLEWKFWNGLTLRHTLRQHYAIRHIDYAISSARLLFLSVFTAKQFLPTVEYLSKYELNSKGLVKVMPRNPKLFIHGCFYEISFRTQQGLPLLCTNFMRQIIEGYLAAAQTMYPVTITDFIVMGNHLHMGIIVKDPQDVPHFVEYFKRESAHAINRLQGVTKRTVWGAEYDSPIIIDAETAINRLVYWYTNPSKANLVERIDEYPNSSSWSAFLSGATKVNKIFKRIPRNCLPVIPKRILSEIESDSINDSLKQLAVGQYQLTIEPLAWTKCFDESAKSDKQQIHKLIVKKIRELEKIFAQKRLAPVLGCLNLKKQSIYKSHTPKKRGKRMVCLGSTKNIRRTYIAFFKFQAQLAKSALMKIRAGIQSAMPPSFFYPGGYILSNISPPFCPMPLA